jgi:hypothetical protein
LSFLMDQDTRRDELGLRGLASHISQLALLGSRLNLDVGIPCSAIVDIICLIVAAHLWRHQG